MIEIDLDPITHTFFADNEPIDFSVTGVLAAMGLYKGLEFMEQHEDKRDLGTHVHNACTFDERGTLDEAGLHESIHGYLESWRLLKRTRKMKTLHVKHKMYSMLYRFAGEVDIIVEIDGEVWILDWKTSAQKTPATELQLAGYGILAKENGINAQRYAEVRLQSDGSMPRIDEYKDQQAGQIFLSMLACARWKKERGL